MGDEAYAADYVSALSTAYVDARQRVWIKELGKFLMFDLTKDAYVRDVKGLLASMGIKEKVCENIVEEQGRSVYAERALAVKSTSGGIQRIRVSRPQEE